jgi:hypothetical protein
MWWGIFGDILTEKYCVIAVQTQCFYYRFAPISYSGHQAWKWLLLLLLLLLLLFDVTVPC